MRFQINNEFDPLKAVLVHRPGTEIERLTHHNMSQFLFEDIPYLRRMQDEHDTFVAKLEEHGVTVYRLESLLVEILADPAVRSEVLAQVCRAQDVPALTDDLGNANHWDVESLTRMLFAGLTYAEYTAATGQRCADAADADPDMFLLDPIPNAYFSRDPAVVVRDGAISSKMFFRERVRETLLVRAVLEHHPDFLENPIVYGASNAPGEDRPFTVEGGDVMVLTSEALFVGRSERTNGAAIAKLAAKFFQRDSIKRIYEIPLPPKRAFMHLDTVFTVLDSGLVLWYGDVMRNLPHIHRYESKDGGGTTRVRDTRTFLEILEAEFDKEPTVIDAAGGDRVHSVREQRMDGVNTFAIAPRVVITYERNERTSAALEAHGVTCIAINGSELVRGLGGPRCMTMPLLREPK
ncbi:MAG: hypothetical protein IH989_00300 [Planctomycetes bacterium]|nr:hypothetical protein [Planctomycetota bacterium]